MVAMVGEEVPGSREVVVNCLSVRLIRMMVKVEEDGWFLEVKGGGFDLGVVNSLRREILGDLMGESGEDTFGVDGGTVW
uniref:Uncharacterized protein n=1 Tax=Tanacetum cinerariifolium TaxID=118510 RepID=A0A6L2N680_TANCI|nr:hypothetical protein [Tanacetum cinerariifolium]